MAKQLLEINKFMNGTVTTPDATDTPEQSASFSINLDCVNKDGVLQGAPINSAVTIKDDDASENAAPDIDKARVIKSYPQDSLREDVVYWDDNSNSLNFISSLEAANTTTRLNHEDTSSIFPAGGKVYSATSLNDIAMEANNKEVHIGMGKYNNPQWVGYTNHNGLDSDGSGQLLAEDAEVKYPSSLPYMKKVVRCFTDSDGDGHVYGVEEGGDRIYKINGLTGEKVSSSAAGTFSNIQSIGSDIDGGKLYVLDLVGNGYVYEVSIDDLSQKDYSWALPGTYPGPSGSNYSDVEYTSTGTKIWLAAHYDNRFSNDSQSSDQYLWSFARAANNNAPTLVNMMPRMSGGDTSTLGTWVRILNEVNTAAIEAEDFAASSTRIYETFPRSLLKHPTDNDAIYWLARYPNGDYIESQETTEWDYRWLTRAVSNISGSTFIDRINSISAKRELVLHRIKNDHSSASNNAGGDFVPIYSVYKFLDTSGQTPINIDSIGINSDGTDIYLTIGDKIQRLAISGSTDINTSWTAAETSSPYNKYFLLGENSVSGDCPSTNYQVTPSGQSERTGVNVNFGYVPTTAGIDANYAADGTNMALLRQSGTAGFDKIAKEFTAGVSGIFFKDHSVMSIVASDVANSSGDLQSAFTYFYKSSMVYDGYQETPLSLETTIDVQASDNTNTKLVLTINDFNQLPKRVSAVKVYRAESTINTDTTPSSFYRLVKTIPLSSSWTKNSDQYSFEFIDTGIKGASFEAESGLAETLEATLPRYSMSAQLNNQHYIGKCYHPGFVEDATSYIFVSKIGKFDVFDWVVDFVKLPTIPTALTSFAGRIFAFDSNNTYRIRGGAGLFIEDIFEGVGCLNDDAIVSTDFGLFFADNNNIYQHNGQSAEPIGEAIVRGDATYSWQNRDKDYHTRAMYDATRRSVYFTFKVNGASKYGAWAWNIPRKRWDMLSFDEGTSSLTGAGSVDTAVDLGPTVPKGFYILNDTSLNIGTGSTVINFLGGATKRLWSWVSKDLTMGNDTQEKSIKKILLPTRIRASVTTDSSKPVVADDRLGADKTRGTHRLTVNQKATNLKVRLDAHAEGNECGAVGVLFRTKRSPR